MSLIPESDSIWDEADPRITTLKHNIFELKADLGKLSLDLNMFRSAHDFLLKKGQPKRDIILLRCLDIITVEEAKALIKMLDSPDEENRVVALETIENLLKTI